MNIVPVQPIKESQLSQEILSLYEEIREGNHPCIKPDSTNRSKSETIASYFLTLLQTNCGLELIRKLRSYTIIRVALSEDKNHSNRFEIGGCILLNPDTTHVYHVVEIDSLSKETAVEKNPPFLPTILFHELVHALYYLNPDPEIKPTQGAISHPSFDDWAEELAIKIGVDGLSENAFRRELGFLPRANHQGSFSPPASELLTSSSQEKKVALHHYVMAGASYDCKQIMRSMTPKEIKDSGALVNAIGERHFHIADSIINYLEAPAEGSSSESERLESSEDLSDAILARAKENRAEAIQWALNIILLKEADVRTVYWTEEQISAAFPPPLRLVKPRKMRSRQT